MEITTSRKFSKGKSAFENIARLQNQICGSKDKDVIISFKESKRYGQSFIFLLGCLTMLGAQEDKNVKLRLPERLEHKFRGMSILDYEKHSTNGAHSFFQIKDANDLIGLIQDNIQGVPIEMSDKLTETMVSLIAEIYNNARDHSQSNYIIGGCYRKSRTKSHSHRFSLSCYDAGIGIIESVAGYLLYPSDITKGYRRYPHARAVSTKDVGVGLKTWKLYKRRASWTRDEHALRFCQGQSWHSHHL